jgi:hypothetical protein
LDQLAHEDSAELPPADVEVLARGTTRRGRAQLYCVRAANGDVFWAFLTDVEAVGCSDAH